MTELSGLIDEHQPRNTDHAGPSVYEPTVDEKKAIKLVERLFDKARRHRVQYDEKWLDYYRMFRGKQWKEQRPTYRHSEVINLIFRTIQSTVPIQVDARPRFEFLPQEPGDVELAELLNEVAEWDWTRFNWSEQLLEVIYDSNIYGTGLSKMTYDPKLARILYESIDPLYCYPDPEARDVNRRCTFFVYAEPTDVARVKRDYPDKKDFIKPDVLDLSKGSKADLSPLRFRSPVDNRTVVEGGNPFDTAAKDQVLKITCWLSPEACIDEFDELEKNDPETGAISFEQVAKYPSGRKIVLANGVLLEDGPNGYDDGLIPYSRYPNYLLPREFWGMSEVEQLEGPQKIFNKLVCFALDVLTLTGNPVWVNPLDSGVDSENLTNRPGLVIEPNSKDTAPYREEGVSLQPFVLQMIDKMAEWFDSVAGSQDVTRGVQPTGVTAASAISSLQEAAQTRIRQKSRNLDVYLQDVGQQWASRTFQFRTTPEIVRLTANDGAARYFRMHVEHYDKANELGQPTGETGTRVMVQPYTEGGQVDPSQLKQFEMRGQLDVRVSTGSSLPFAKDEKEKKLLNFFDRGIIDEEEVLKGSDYPNWQAVLQRVQQKKAAEQQAQMAAKGSAPTGPQAA